MKMMTNISRNREDPLKSFYDDLKQSCYEQKETPEIRRMRWEAYIKRIREISK